MRKPEDMTPKKIKRPDKGYVGGAVPFETPQAPVVPAYVTIDNIKRVAKPKNEGLLKAIAKKEKKETTLAQVILKKKKKLKKEKK